MSPESVNKLRRHKARIEKDRAVMDIRLTAGIARGKKGFVVQETREDIRELEERMAEVLQLYSPQLRAGVEQPGEEGTSKHNKLYQKWQD